jgi:hypothetical protein
MCDKHHKFELSCAGSFPLILSRGDLKIASQLLSHRVFAPFCFTEQVDLAAAEFLYIFSEYLCVRWVQ